ncbi:FAD-dependent oxidoreductase [uncultured Roseobacter sp.]|uniref:NAD(P)/FAD-dependent oxidoreductase n=1 Tax=uncultured Roseobacter sp. TaxID=114847 RepID=UPI00262066F6|nr:FAD-dependent oxidoreductase [uncultured Roseobacter sp.]
MTSPKNVSADNRQDTIKLRGSKSDAKGYEMRDFLQRSGISFEWEEQSGTLTAEISAGKTLDDPNVTDLARALGLVIEPSCAEYDVSIYGAGPAGLSAAVYAASEGLSTVLIEKHAVGGQAGTTSNIENYLGFPEGLAGVELASRAREQALKFGVEILMMREGVKAEFQDNRIHAELANGKTMVARSNICATGVEWHRLGLEREQHFLGSGLYYGAGVSEAPLCKGEHVYVVGGGNSAGQAVMHLADHADQVTMVVRGPGLAASMSRYLQERIEKTSNVSVIYNAEITALDGDDRLSRIELTRDGEKTSWWDTGRLFVAIGGVPHTEWAKDTDIIRDKAGYIITGPDLLKNGKPPDCWKLNRPPHFLESSVPGSFAAGDVRHRSIKRVATAVGEGAMAVAFVHRYLSETYG